MEGVWGRVGGWKWRGGGANPHLSVLKYLSLYRQGCRDIDTRGLVSHRVLLADAVGRCCWQILLADAHL